MSEMPEWIRKVLEREGGLRRDVVAWPLAGFNVGPMGAHGAWRGKPSDGWCPYRNGRKKEALPEIEAVVRPGDYPCKHYGADLQAPEGSKVYAPHDGWILYSGPATERPFVGYGPGAILIAHADISDSLWGRLYEYATRPLISNWTDFPEGQVATRYSLLGHVVPVGAADRADNEPHVPLAADVLASTKTKPDPDHWRKLKDGSIVMMTDATAVKENASGLVRRWVNAGDHIGYVSNANHVHWEIRTAPLAGKDGRLDPIDMWQRFYEKPLPTGSTLDEPARTQPSSGGGAGILLLLAAVAFGKKRKRAGVRRSR